MRILIDHGSSQLDNLGDIAMLQVTVERLHACWPEAEIRAVARAPEGLAAHVPLATPVVIHYPSAWHRLQRLIGGETSLFPRRFRQALEGRLSQTLPAEFTRILSKAVDDADLVVHSGAGIMADPFLSAALRRLWLLRQAVERGKPTALFGQGMGPVTQTALRRAIRDVLSQVDLASVRDRASGVLAAELTGKAVCSFPVTGDDALELAFRGRRTELGTNIGLNLRLAPYSGMGSEDDLDQMDLRAILQATLRQIGRAVRPLAVHREDLAAVRSLAGPAIPSGAGADHAFTVPALIGAISECRMVITGSYHGAVLALGQGIPALCLSRSAYYDRKFSGLREQFPESCRVADLTEAAALARLLPQADDLWRRGEDLRPITLARTRAQLEQSHAVYRDFADQIGTT